MKRFLIFCISLFVSNISFAQLSVGGGQELDFGVGIKYKSVTDEYVHVKESYRGYIFSAYGRYNSFDEDNFFWVELGGDGGFLKSGYETHFDNRLGHTASFFSSSGYLWRINGRSREMNIYLGPSIKARAQYDHIIHEFDSDKIIYNHDSYLFLSKVAASAIMDYAPYRSGWSLRWQLDLPLFSFYYKAAEGTNFTYLPNLISANTSLRYLRNFGSNYKLGATSKIDYYSLKADYPISYLSASIFFTVIMEID
jgi:hypothetical protein